MTGSRHDRLAEHMDHRRLELGLSWKEVAAGADVSEATLRAIRNGTNAPSALSKRGIERALEWVPGSVQRVLNGEEPGIAAHGDLTLSLHENAADEKLRRAAALLAEATAMLEEIQQERRQGA